MLRFPGQASLILILSSLALSAEGCTSEYVPYVPIETRLVNGEPCLVKAPEVINDAHMIAFQIVLWNYHQPYEVRDGRVYIERRLQDDPDLLTNYTEKAELLSRAQIHKILSELP